MGDFNYRVNANRKMADAILRQTPPLIEVLKVSMPMCTSWAGDGML